MTEGDPSDSMMVRFAGTFIRKTDGVSESDNTFSKEGREHTFESSEQDESIRSTWSIQKPR